MAELESATKSSGPTLNEEPDLRRIGDRDSGTVVPVAPVRHEHPVLGLQRIFGNRAVGQMLGSPFLQPKLTVGAPDDVYEKEADEVAQEVTSQSALAGVSDAGAGGAEDEDSRNTLQLKRAAALSVLQRVPIRTLQKTLGNGQFGQLLREAFPALAEPELRRKCACGGQLQEECEECRTKRLSVQRASSGRDAGMEAPPIVEDVLRTAGQPLADSARQTLEPRFGHDFSHVRVHDDSKAAESASAVNAHAYTVGNHIVFGSGKYAPGTQDGNHLLAHELTHVVQQRANSAPAERTTPQLDKSPEDCDETPTIARRLLTVNGPLRQVQRYKKRAERLGPRDANGVATGAEAALDRAASSIGEPLPGAVRSRFEDSRGADLSDVRVHTGGEFAEAAKAVGAKAYTVGQDIHFGADHYAPTDPAGIRLLAHEVTHTVQNRGGAPARRNRPEVSNPADEAEAEADRAADATVAGASFGIGRAVYAPKTYRNAPVTVYKATPDNQVEGTAKAGAEELQKQQAGAPAIVLRVGNERDIQIAESFLRVLQNDQPKIEAGASMASPTQDDSNIPSEIVHGKEHKLKTQIPVEAIKTNSELINALELYLVEARRQSTGTSQFQEQYRLLLHEYGRLEGIAKNYAGMSLQDVHNDKDAGSMVQNAVGAGGHSTSELSATFKELLAHDPGVQNATKALDKATESFEEMPGKLAESQSHANVEIASFDTALVTLEHADAGVKALALKNGFAEAKAKIEESRKFSGKIKDILLEGAKDGIKEGAKAAAEKLALDEGISALGAAAAEGGPAAGIAIAKGAAEKFVLEPLKEAVNSALTNADAAVGVIDKAKALAMQQEAEQAKQDAETMNTYYDAKKQLALTKQSIGVAVKTYVDTAIEFDKRRLETRTAFKELGNAIQKAAKGRGKAGEGKALSEMVSFLQETEEFVVQANAVTEIGTKELSTASPASGSGEEQSSVLAAAEAMKKWNGKTYWAAHEYPFKKADGTVVTYYGAQEVSIRVESFFATNEEEKKGLGSAEGGEMSANAAIPEAVKNVEMMKLKVSSVRAQISTQVFGSGGT